MHTVLLCTGMDYSTQLMAMCALPWTSRHAKVNGVLNQARDMGHGDSGTDKDVLIIAYRAQLDEHHAMSVSRCIASRWEMMSGAETTTQTVTMDECCLSCTIKHDLYEVISRLDEDEQYEQYEHIIAILPQGLQAAPTAEYLQEMGLVEEALRHETQRFAVQSIVAVLDGASFADQLFDDTPFSPVEYAQNQGDEQHHNDANDYDERCVGGAMAEVIADANHIVLLPDAALQRAQTEQTQLIEALASQECVVHSMNLELDAAMLTASKCSAQGPQTEGDNISQPDETGVVTWAALGKDVIGISIRSHAPVHPSRLSDVLADTRIPMHIHGHFCVPNKPFSAFIWQGDPDGSIIETVDGAIVEEAQYATEIFVVARIEDGHGSAAAFDCIHQFQQLLVTKEERERPLLSWMEQSDTFTRWASME